MQPKEAALAFIFSAKAALLPATCSARAFPTSFADFNNSAYRHWRTDKVSPSVMPIETAPDSSLVVAVEDVYKRQV